MGIHVAGHYRLGKSGKREWVDGYTRSGTPSAPDVPSGRISAAPKATPVPKASKATTPPSGRTPRSPGSVKAAMVHARLVKKRQAMFPSGPPTSKTPGWTESADGRPVMTDETYADWINNTIRRSRDALNSKGDTAKKFKTVAGGLDYTNARKKQHKAVIDAFMERAAKTPREHKLVMTGGRPGAGKSSSLRAQGITEENYFVIDSDAVKEEMIRQGLAPDIEGLTPFESAGLIHEESSDLADILVERLAMRGTNLVLDGTMAWAPYVKRHADDLHDMGYTVKGLFVEVTPETSLRRAKARHKEGVEKFLTRGIGYGGRFVDPSISTRSSNNRSNFEELKDLFESWVMYDNEVDGRPPMMMDASHREVRFSVPNLTDRNQDDTLVKSDYYLKLSLSRGGG